MRLKEPPAFLDETICYLREHVQRIKAELVFNLDEVGMSQWEDRKDKKVIVPKTMDGQTIPYRASQNVRHISTITYITASGESLMPYTVISRDSESIRQKLMSRGVRLAIDLVLRQRPKPYVNGKLFLECINNIFVSYLNEPHELEEFKIYEAVLLIDSCSHHMSDNVVAVLTRMRAKIIIFATQTTHIFQMLDIMLSDTLKKHATGLDMLDEEQPAAAFLLKVYHDFKQTTVEVSI
jgi:hypothetical protein